ncbi:hypothetical protein AB9K33_13870 [Citrobacter freundii]|uniref:hypothetical protein n=1 Tax=Citrobacter freundii TaxID=546 RepID=UPI00339CF548
MELNQLQQMRAFNLTQISNAIDEVDRTVELSFASEIPVTREIEGQLYNEILLCNSDNVDLSRLNDGAPVLIEHDASRQVGIVENARVDMDKVCRATVRFSALGSANTIFGMILEGIRPKVSVGYNIREYYFEGNDLIVTRWEPYEISSVSTPADNSVGIGRSLNSNDEITLKDETQIMDENLNQEVITEEVQETVEVQEEVQEVITEEKAVVAEDIQEVEVQIEVEAERSIDISSIVDAVKESLNKDVEDKRVRELQSISAVLGIDTNEAIKNNVSVEEFKRSLNKENHPIDKEIKMEQKNVIAEGLRSLKGEANELATLDRGSRGYSVDMNAMVRSTSDTVSTVNAAGLVKEQLADSYIRELLARTVLGQRLC